MNEVYECPNCHKPIYDPDALLCHFCGDSLERAGGGFLSKIRYSNKEVVWYFLLFVLLVSFVFLYIF